MSCPICEFRVLRAVLAGCLAASLVLVTGVNGQESSGGNQTEVGSAAASKGPRQRDRVTKKRRKNARTAAVKKPDPQRSKPGRSGSGAPVWKSAPHSVAEAIAFTRRTLDYVQRSAPRPGLASELDALEQQVGGIADPNANALIGKVLQLRRRIIFSHPALNFERLLINKRPPPAFSHQSDQYLGRYSGPGDGLVILEHWKKAPRAVPLTQDLLPIGSTLHPELSFDGRRILFSFCDHRQTKPEQRRFFIYEIGVDGSALRQVTGTATDPLLGTDGRQTVQIEDWDPCYLPDGGIAFVSTRNQGGVRCHHGGRYCPTYTLYRCNADGANIQPMVFGEANEWDPSVLHDGRIIWTRWDYINRHDTIYQSLWTIHADGTGTAHFYGNYTRNPCSIAEARAIPGSHRIVATATAHHSYTCGSIIKIDPLVGQDGPAPIERVTPEIPFPETEAWGNGAAATPWPLNEELFLVAYSPERHARQGQQNARNAYAIYLVDTLGGRELIYHDPDQSCFAPIPLQPRSRPPVLASALPSHPPDDTGTFEVSDVYRSSATLPRGTVKRLRVLRMYPQPTIRVPDRSATLFETAKEVLGTAAVAEDGSVAFRAPAGVPLMFQLLDENGMAIMSMRTFVYAHAGERVTCVGCHDSRHASPPSALARRLRVQDLKPSVGPQYEGGLSFVRTVQPVLDQHCITCHGLKETAGGISLLGTMDGGPIKLGKVRANTAYHALVGRAGLVSIAYRNKETAFSVPRDYYSSAGRLAYLLRDGDANHTPLGGPHGTDQDGFQRIVDWLDVNAEFYGDYSWNKAEWATIDPESERALRAAIAARFGNELATQPYSALVNIAMPSESRILKGPLAKAAGGWGQIPHGWLATHEAGYQELDRLVRASIRPLRHHDVAGTCGRTPCECGSCWVRQSRAQYRAQTSHDQVAVTPAAKAP